MIIKIGEHHVDVLDAKCKGRSCYALGFDKGVYVKGRGYIHYHDKPLPVCWTRHISGCPVHSVCPECRTTQVEGVSECDKCRVKTIPLRK